MKSIRWYALACASMMLAGCPQGREAEQRAMTSNAAATQMAVPPSATVAASGVTLSLDTQPISGVINKGDRYVATMSGHWQATSAGTIYLQVSDSAGAFVAPAPTLASTRKSTYTIGLGWPAAMAPGVYTGTLSIRACEDSLCGQPYAGTLHSVGYTMTVNKVGEWETLQRTSRHDGYVPITLDASRYHKAWTFESSWYLLSGVVTDSDTVYFSEPNSSGPVSVYAKRATDGVTTWRHVFTSTYGFGPDVAPPSISDGVVYVATTAEEDTWVHALRASDGVQTYQSQFFTQWGSILNPTVRNGKVYVNAGTYTGVVYAFNVADGSASWTASGGTYGKNTPAVDDEFVYSYNGETLDVFNATDGSLATSIGSTPGGVYDDYNASPILGSADHVLAYRGNARYQQSRQLLDYSLANRAMRWMSIALYNAYPAVAKGVVYAASDETGMLDALDEATGRVLWSWKPSEQTINFIGNVVVTDNVVLVSTFHRIYAIDLQHHRAIWSAPTPGTMSLSANRMLFVSSPLDSSTYPTTGPRITAYRLN